MNIEDQDNRENVNNWNYHLPEFLNNEIANSSKSGIEPEDLGLDDLSLNDSMSKHTLQLYNLDYHPLQSSPPDSNKFHFQEDNNPSYKPFIPKSKKIAFKEDKFNEYQQEEYLFNSSNVDKGEPKKKLNFITSSGPMQFPTQSYQNRDLGGVRDMREQLNNKFTYANTPTQIPHYYVNCQSQGYIPNTKAISNFGQQRQNYGYGNHQFHQQLSFTNSSQPSVVNTKFNIDNVNLNQYHPKKAINMSNVSHSSVGANTTLFSSDSYYNNNIGSNEKLFDERNVNYEEIPNYTSPDIASKYIIHRSNSEINIPYLSKQNNNYYVNMNSFSGQPKISAKFMTSSQDEVDSTDIEGFVNNLDCGLSEYIKTQRGSRYLTIYKM